MGKQPGRAKRASANHIPMPFADYSSLTAPLVNACLKTNQAMMESMFSFNREVMDFAGARLRADMKIFQSMCQCRNLQEIAELQSGFARSAAEAYQEEFSRLTEKGLKATADTLTPLYDAAEEATEAGAHA